MFNIILIFTAFYYSSAAKLFSKTPLPIRNLQFTQKQQECIDHYNILVNPFRNSPLVYDPGQIWIDQSFPQTKALAVPENQKNKPIFISASSKNLIKIFGDQGIKVSDISQGYLGNCYILSVIQSLADHPKILQQTFLNEENQSRMYATRWFVGGREIRVVIDDRFAATQNGQWAYAGITNDDQLWPLILEKAWAKLSGSYKNTQSGWPSRVFYSLTGAPVQTIFHSESNQPEIFSKILKGYEHKYPINAATGQNTCNIVSSHAYSVLGAYAQVKADNGQIYNLVKIRNPHGKNSWNGEFSDSSSLWNDQLKKQYDVGSDPGIFFMNSSKYFQCFQGTIVNHLIDDYTNYFQEFEEVTQAVSKFRIADGQKFAVSVYFINQRFILGGSGQCESAKKSLKFTISKVQSDATLKTLAIYFRQAIDSSVWIQNDDINGEYQVNVQVQWDQNIKYLRKFQVNVYSEETIYFNDSANDYTFGMILGILFAVFTLVLVILVVGLCISARRSNRMPASSGTFEKYTTN